MGTRGEKTEVNVVLLTKTHWLLFAANKHFQSRNFPADLNPLPAFLSMIHTAVFLELVVHCKEKNTPN